MKRRTHERPKGQDGPCAMYCTQSKSQTSGKNWVFGANARHMGHTLQSVWGDRVSRVTQMMNFLMAGPNNPVYANRGQWGGRVEVPNSAHELKAIFGTDLEQCGQ